MKNYLLNKNELKAVLKGGHVVHVLPVNDNGKAERLAPAICGRAPSEQRGGCFKRAGWYGTVDPVSCPKCLEIIRDRESSL